MIQKNLFPIYLLKFNKTQLFTYFTRLFPVTRDTFQKMCLHAGDYILYHVAYKC